MPFSGLEGSSSTNLTRNFSILFIEYLVKSYVEYGVELI